MTITPAGQAIIKSKDDGQSYIIQANELDWNQISGDERQMGPEIQYLGDIQHPVLGRLNWSVWEYPIGMFNHSDHDINGHILEANFTFDPVFEKDEDWDDDIDHAGLERLADDQLRVLPPEKQQKYIIDWFHSQFQEPGREHLYGGVDGAYQFSQGGPYKARVELKTKFGGVIVENIIESAVEAIEADEIFEWAPSAAHPDRLRGAEDYFESVNPLTAEEIRAALESGATINLDSPAAQYSAEELKKSLEALIAAISARQPEHGGIGHNGPALDDEGNPLPDGFENELRETAIVLSAQIEADSPDPIAVVDAATQLQRFRAWLKPRIDIAADEFAKEIGKGTAKAIIWVGSISLMSILPGLDTAIAAALNWLQAILL